MAIPKWAQSYLQQGIDDGSIDHSSLGPEAQSTLTPRNTEQPHSGVARFRDIENADSTPEATQAAFDVGNSFVARAKEAQRQREENAPLYQKAFDTAFNKVPRALSTSWNETKKWENKYGARNSEGNLYNDPGTFVYNSALSSLAGIEGLKEGWNSGPDSADWAQALKTSGMKDNGLTDFLGGTLDLATSPSVGIGGKLIGKGVSKYLPEAPKLGQRVLGAGATGFTQGTGSSLGKGATIPEALKQGALDAALWAGTDFGLNAIAGGAKAAGREVGDRVFAPREGDLLDFRNIPVTTGRGQGTRANPLSNPILDGDIPESLDFMSEPATAKTIDAEGYVGPQPKTFSELMEELKPEVDAYTTPPQERSKALVDYIHEGMGGQISKNEIRKMNYAQLSSMAQDIANQRKADMWGTAREIARQKGYDLDNLYRMETDPAYAAERIRMADVAGVPEQTINLKQGGQEPFASQNWKKPSRGLVTNNRPAAFTSETEPSLIPSTGKEPSAINNATPEAPPVYTSETDSSLAPSTDLNIAPEGVRGNGGQGPNLKRTQQPPEIQELNAGLQKGFGPFKRGGVEHAPEAMQKPEFQAANELARTISGREIIPFKGQDYHGANIGNKVYINAETKQPVAYITAHELAHTIETTSPETFSRLMQIVQEHVADSEGLRAHYEKFGYKPEDLPRELTADATAESMLEPTFWARVRNQAPEILKPMLDALDSIIAKVAQRPGQDMTIAPYLKDIETMRNRLADEYRGYLADVQGGEVQAGEGIAAKSSDGSYDLNLIAQQAKEAKVQADTQNFSNQLDQWAVGALPPGKVITVGDTPKVLQLLGAKQLPISITKYTLEKVVYPQGKGLGKHGLPLDLVKQLPEQLHDPIMIFESRTQPNSLVVMTELEHQGNTVIAAIHLAKQQARYLVNDIASIYGKDNDLFFSRNIRDGYLRYINNKKAQNWFMTRGLQLPKVRGTSGPSTTNILTEADLVKAESQIYGENISPKFKLDKDRPVLDQVEEMVQFGAKQIPKSGGLTQHWLQQMEKQFPQLADEAQKDSLLRYVAARADELKRTGQTTLKGMGQERAIGKTATPAVGAKIAQTEVNGPLPDTSQVIVSKTGRQFPGVKQGIKKGAAKSYKAMVDDLYALHQFDTAVNDNLGKMPANDRAYLQAINNREAGGTSKYILENKLVDSQGNEIGQSLKDVLKTIPKGQEGAFKDYVILRNSISWMEQGKQVYPKELGMTPELATAKVAQYEQSVLGIKEAADNLVNWQRKLGQAWLVDTGILKPEAWEAYQKAHPYYVPFQREMKPVETGGQMGKGAKRGFANQSNPTKAAEGSERPIIDPIESIIEQTDRYVKVARRNEVMQTVIRNLEKDPEGLAGFGEIVPSQKGVAETVDDLLKKGSLEDFINWMEEPYADMWARKNAKQHLDRPNVLTGLVDGERVHVRMQDPGMIEALTNLTPTGQNAFVEWARQVTRTMKVLTTGANVFFAARNIARDLPVSYIASRTTNNPIRWAWDILDAFARIATNGKYDPGSFYKDYKAMGGGAHAASIASDRNLLSESKSRVMPGYWSLQNNNPLSYAKKGLKAGLQGVEKFTNATETMPRFPEYKRTVQQGGTKAEGLHAAQDITVNFSRKGNLGHTLDAFIPYLNASLQGIDKLARIYASNPVAATAKSLLAITVPTMWLYMHNKDNPAYQKLSSWTKDNYYCVPKGDGTFVKIAKPREAGVVFSDLVERSMKRWGEDDPEGFKGFSEAWINNFIPPYRPTFMPFVDVLANKNYAGNPIVPGYQQKLSPELQYDQNTSAPAKKLGELIGYSPKKIDYLARGYTGFLGEFGIPAMAEGKGEGAGARVGQVLKNTFIADPLYSNDVLNEFYDEKEKQDTAYSNSKAMGKKDPGLNPGRRSKLTKAADTLSDIQKEVRKVDGNSSLSLEAKEQRRRLLQQRMLNVAQQALK